MDKRRFNTEREQEIYAVGCRDGWSEAVSTQTERYIDFIHNYRPTYQISESNLSILQIIKIRFLRRLRR